MRVRGMVVLVLVAAGCGGGGGGDEGGGGGDPLIPPEQLSSVYSDVRGYDVAPGAEAVQVGKWPSWLHEKELVDACAPGQAFYADRCWDTVSIDADAGVVTFSGSAAGAEHLALREPLPQALGPMILFGSGQDGPCGDGGGDEWVCAWPHHPNTGYVFMAGPLVGGGYDVEDVWDFPISPLPGGSPTIRSPWAIGSQVSLTAGVVSGFLVKTTQLYGFVATAPIPTFYDFRVVHNWSYQGSIKVNGVTLTLPVTLGAVAAATGAVAGRTAEGSKYIDVAGNTVRFVSHKDVKLARETWGGAGSGLTDEDLVTTVELQTTAMWVP